VIAPAAFPIARTVAKPVVQNAKGEFVENAPNVKTMFAG